MTRPVVDRECARCSVGTAAATSPFCASCNRTINRMIARAFEAGELNNDDIAELVGLTRTAVEKRKSRLRRAQAVSA